MNNSFLLIILLVSLLSSCGTSEVNNSELNAESNKKVEPDTLKFLTYNVMGSTFRPQDRIPALLDIINESDADIVALQEVDMGILNALRNDPFIMNDYYFSSISAFRLKGGLLFLSRGEIKDTDYHQLIGTRLNRFVLLIEIKRNKETVTIANTHLDSPLNYGKLRAEQLDYISILMKKAENRILLGDFNFGDLEEPETSHINAKYRDVWTELFGYSDGFTWNIEDNNMALRGSFPTEKSRRLDRIMVDLDAWKVHDCVIIGNKPIVENNKDIFPSDHFGLLGTIVIN